ncbi:MAG: PAS domain-containing protein [Microthrixaceae bacterium]|nr:PAS domain-containing protein [Microthrixaceae bacterium]
MLLRVRAELPTGFLMEIGDSEPPKVDDDLLACLAGNECPDVLAVLDVNFTARWVSPSVEAVLGYGQTDLIGAGIADIVHLEDLAPIVNGIAEATRFEGRHAAVECRLRSATGVWVPTRASSATFDRDGETWWVLSIRAVADDDLVLGRRARLQVLAQEAALTCSEMRSDERGALVTIMENLAAVIGASGVAVWSCHDGESRLSTSWTRGEHDSVPRPIAPAEVLASDGYVVHHGPDEESGAPHGGGSGDRTAQQSQRSRGSGGGTEPTCRRGRLGRLQRRPRWRDPVASCTPRRCGLIPSRRCWSEPRPISSQGSTTAPLSKSEWLC